MKKLLLTLPLLLSLLCVFGQSTYLTVNLKEKAPISAYIYLNQGSTLIPVDSIILGKGTFSFNTSKLKPGVYSFVLSQDMFTRFIINNENIEVSTSIEGLTDSLKVQKSEENKVYYAFIHERESFNKKIEAISTLLKIYPAKSKLSKALSKEKKKVEIGYNNTIQELINTKGNLLASQIILSEMPVKAPDNLSPEQQRQYLITNWWSSFPFENPYITNTPGISDRLWDYIDLFYVEGISRQEQDTYFERAIDEVMNQPSISIEVQEFFKKEMIKTFSESSHETLIGYIQKTYAQNGSQNLDAEFDRISKTSIGRIAPNFTIETDTSRIELYKIKSKGIALLFWSIECSHCRKLLPELKKNYKTIKADGYEIIAINLDAYRPAWRQDIKTNDYRWINANIQNPFNDPITTNYNITGTPTIFMLDAEKRITEKPNDIKSILKAFEGLGYKK